MNTTRVTCFFYSGKYASSVPEHSRHVFVVLGFSHRGRKPFRHYWLWYAAAAQDNRIKFRDYLISKPIEVSSLPAENRSVRYSWLSSPVHHWADDGKMESDSGRCRKLALGRMVTMPFSKSRQFEIELAQPFCLLTRKQNCWKVSMIAR